MLAKTSQPQTQPALLWQVLDLHDLGGKGWFHHVSSLLVILVHEISGVSCPVEAAEGLALFL